MKICLSRRGFFAIVINMILAILMMLTTPTFNWMFPMGIIILCSFVINIVMLEINGLKLMSFSTIFIVMSYVFYFGQIVLNAFFPNYQFSSVIKNFAKNNESVRGATIFSYFVIQSIETWMILFRYRRSSGTTKNIGNLSSNNNKIRAIAWIFVIVFLPINLYLNLRAIAISRYSTYAKALASLTESGGYMLLFSIFLVIGMSLMLYAYPEIKRIIFLIEIVYLLLMTLSGSRIYSMISITIIALCYINSFKAFNYKKITLIAILGYFFLNIINAISRIRLFEQLDISTIIVQSINNKNNVILQMLEEFGGTIQSVVLPFEQVPGTVDWGYGLTYLKGVVTIIPNIGGLTSDISRDASYMNNLYNTTAMGGSYIGELYYNFGLMGILFTPLIAYMLVKINDSFDNCIKNKDYYHLAFYIMPMYSCLIWIRGYFSFFYRAIVWASFLLLIIGEMLVKHRE